MKALVVFGGTFDPPHRYHVLAPLAAARRSVGPGAWVLYVPAARNPLKASAASAGDAHRLAMLRLALAGPGRRSIWTDELDRSAWQRARGVDRPSYMIDTLRRLRRVAPRGVRLRLLIGADQATQFHLWKHHRAILRLAEPIVLPRTPILTADALRAAMDARTWTRAEREAWAGRLAPVAPMPAAATDVRKAIPRAPRDPARWTRGPLAYVPRHVARYIANHHLYEFGSTSRDRSAP